MIRLLRRHLQSQSGIAATYLLAALAGLVLNLFALGMRYGFNSTEWVQIRDCVEKVKVAKEAIQKTLAADPDGSSVSLDDPNAVVLQRCQALAEQLKNDPAFGNKAGSLGNLIGNTLASVGKCEMLEPTKAASGIAGRDLTIPVIATIPIGTFSTDFAAQASLSGGGVSAAAAALTRRTGSDGVSTWSGTLVIPGASSKNVTDGASSTVVVTAAGTTMEGADGQEKPIVPRPDGTCPFGLVRAGNVCRISCTVSKAGVTWKVPPPIQATLSPSVTSDTTASLTWTTENAKTVRLQGPGLPGGAASLGTTGSFPVKRGDQDQTYTLTASAPDVADKTATAVVPKTVRSFTVTLSSGGNDFTTDATVTVGGNVTPTPPAGAVVAIGVNGAPVTAVNVGGGGSYFATITLPKQNSIGRLSLTNPGVNVFVCGGFASAVTLSNNSSVADVANVVTAALFKDGEGVLSNTATVQIVHTVRVVSATVSWGGQCPGPPVTFPVAGRILRAGEVLQLGEVTCGFPCPATGTECTATAQSSVSTSVCSMFVNAFWSIDIQ